MNSKRLTQLDRAARRAGLSRSAYLAGLVERVLGSGVGPGADPDVRRAMADMHRLVAKNPPPADFDVVETIRKMRDTR